MNVSNLVNILILLRDERQYHAGCLFTGRPSFFQNQELIQKDGGLARKCKFYVHILCAEFAG